MIINVLIYDNYQIFNSYIIFKQERDRELQGICLFRSKNHISISSKYQYKISIIKIKLSVKLI